MAVLMLRKKLNFIHISEFLIKKHLKISLTAVEMQFHKNITTHSIYN